MPVLRRSPNIFYISRKLVGANKARRIVRNCLDLLQIVSVTRDLLDAAERWSGSDFKTICKSSAASKLG